MTYQIKYEPYIIGSQAKPTTTRKIRRRSPETWISGPDPIEHDKYYAWQKHRAQARYRKEDYNLSWEDFRTLWPNDMFVQRGRRPDDYCMIRLDSSEPWEPGNVEVVTRLYHLSTQKERLK